MEANEPAEDRGDEESAGLVSSPWFWLTVGILAAGAGAATWAFWPNDEVRFGSPVFTVTP
jgi:hypothetical protein